MVKKRSWNRVVTTPVLRSYPILMALAVPWDFTVTLLQDGYPENVQSEEGVGSRNHILRKQSVTKK